MNKLESELQRLYCLPGQTWPILKSATVNPAIGLVSSAGLVRCLVLSVERACTWAPVAALCQAVQETLDLPVPAISVSVEDGFQVWFSLAEPVSLQMAQDFMAGLCRRYLAEVKAAKIKLRPGSEDALRSVPLVPLRQENAERWSAYIDPAMGGMFVEETWLEMAPSLDKQAAMLAGLESMGVEDFQRALSILQSIPEPSSQSIEHLNNQDSASPDQNRDDATLTIGSGFTDPKTFLLAVMNSSSATAEQRIAAAIALLPFFDKNSAK